MTPTQEQTYGSVEQLEDGRWQLRFTRTLAHRAAEGVAR